MGAKVFRMHFLLPWMTWWQLNWAFQCLFQPHIINLLLPMAHYLSTTGEISQYRLSCPSHHMHWNELEHFRCWFLLTLMVARELLWIQPQWFQKSPGWFTAGKSLLLFRKLLVAVVHASRSWYCGTYVSITFFGRTPPDAFFVSNYPTEGWYAN